MKMINSRSNLDNIIILLKAIHHLLHQMMIMSYCTVFLCVDRRKDCGLSRNICCISHENEQ